MKTFKFSLVRHTCENTDVFITLDENIYDIHHKRINILYVEGFIPSLKYIVFLLMFLNKKKKIGQISSSQHSVHFINTQTWYSWYNFP